jgi:2-polyprenyl-3-methyl-5-hydroxy-6-metoxy-1,4-benzoquinol methylase
MPAEQSREYQALKRRGFKPYSRGHQLMYLAPLTLMERVSAHHPANRAAEPYRILEAGFGIGWGLDQMIARGLIGRYLGFEPDSESFDYVAGRMKGYDNLNIELVHRPFEHGIAAYADERFDHGFCIEVIEHVEAVDHLPFLQALRAAVSGTLWFSTPDRMRSNHGVRAASDWRILLHEAGFGSVTHHPDQWTDLYICQ